MRDGRWKYTIKAFRTRTNPSQPGRAVLVIETTHATEASRNIEIEAFRERMKRGEISYIEVLSHVEPYGIETIFQ
jgi:hypothetical protein